jgi:hypothetical protein
MPQETEQETGAKTLRGLQVEVSAPERELAPHFEPLIRRIEEVVKEATGSACSQVVAVKMRW